jgi:WhiB family redox-sensing transcriptional regulator
MTLEATCRPEDLFRDDQVLPLTPPTLCADIESVEDALAAGLVLPCQDHDPDLFFAESPVEVERAKALCTDCPVKELCLAAALERREPWGVWGGEWFAAGEAVGRKRPRGRPRKDGSIGPRPAPVQRRPASTRTKEVAA